MGSIGSWRRVAVTEAVVVVVVVLVVVTNVAVSLVFVEVLVLAEDGMGV